MTLRDQLIAENHGSIEEAAAHLALRLTRGNPETLKAGYEIPSAILAAREIFPEVDEQTIRAIVNARGQHPEWIQ